MPLEVIVPEHTFLKESVLKRVATTNHGVKFAVTEALDPNDSTTIRKVYVGGRLHDSPQHNKLFPETETPLGGGIHDVNDTVWGSESLRKLPGYDRPNHPNVSDKVEMNHAETEALRLEVRQSILDWANS